MPALMGLTVFWVLFLLTVACVPPLPEQPVSAEMSEGPAIPEPGLESAVSVDRIMADIAFLAADRLAGRASGMPGAEETRDYLVQRLKESGARPGMLTAGCLPEVWGEPTCQADWIQRFNVAVVVEPGPSRIGFRYRAAPQSSARERVNAAAVVARQLAAAGDDGPMWRLEPNSPAGNVLDAPVVFAGYGIQADKWSDYADVDVTGSLVVVLAGAPEKDIGTMAQTRLQSLVTYKASVARHRGAVGLVVLHDELPQLQPSEGPEGPTDIPVVHVSREWLELHIPEFSLDETLAFMKASGKAQSKALPLVGGLESAPTMGEVETWNVVGLLGPELGAKAPVVVTAHYDHLSNGSGYSLVGRVEGPFNGADDNASGVAVVLELAQVLGEHESDLKRPVLFVLTGGEELGLEGSRAFIRDHAIGPSRTLAVLNLDMVGRLESGPLYVDELDSAVAFGEAVEGALRGLELVVTRPVDELHGSSEHDAFLMHGVPSVSLTTGWHADWHAPGDDIDKLDRVGLGVVARFSLRLLHRFAVVNDLTVALERSDQ